MLSPTQQSLAEAFQAVEQRRQAADRNFFEALGLTAEGQASTEAVVKQILQTTNAETSLERRMSAIIRQCLLPTFDLPLETRKYLNHLSYAA